MALEMNNYLDFYNIFVNELAGSKWTFIFLALLIIIIIMWKFRISSQVGLIMIFGFILIFATYIGNKLLLTLMIFAVGLIFYWAWNRFMHRG